MMYDFAVMQKGFYGKYVLFEQVAEKEGGAKVRTLVTGGITVFSPTGEKLEYWQGPEPYCTNIAFGGPDMRTAYITLSTSGKLVSMQWDEPGFRLPHG